MRHFTYNISNKVTVILMMLLLINIMIIFHINNIDGFVMIDPKKAKIIGMDLVSGSEMVFNGNYRPYSPPSIHDKNIVWVDLSTKKSPLYLGNLVTGNIEQIGKKFNSDPFIYNENLVYFGRDRDFGPGDLYLYNISSGVTQLLSLPIVKSYYEPELNDQYVAIYSRDFYGVDYSTIHIWELNNNTNHIKLKFENKIWGLALQEDNVYYVIDINGNHSLSKYNISNNTNSVLLNKINFVGNGLSIDGNNIAWPSNRINIYNYRTGTLKYINSTLINLPEISDNLLVYSDVFNDKYGDYYTSFIYNLSDDSKSEIKNFTSIQLAREQMLPAISGNWVVWFDGYDSGYPGIQKINYWYLSLLLIIPATFVIMLFIIPRHNKKQNKTMRAQHREFRGEP